MSAQSTIVPGAILLEKYRVEKVLGQGGMGTVLAAHHLALNESVAIKVLVHSASQHREALARLQREARILARLRNEHVVHVIDLGRLDDGSPFMVMEHLAGRDLASLLEQEGRLNVEQAVGFVLQALVALAAAHANGIVHRDLKPENLFCAKRRDGSSVIKVLDFGISRLEQLDPGQGATPLTHLTHPSAVMGTPLYMSPEQWRDSTGVDGRSDIWSIGVVLYELVTGVSPFSGASLGDIAIKVATEPTPPLSNVEPGIAPALEAVLDRCLQKNRERRFANVADLARALQPLGPAGCEQLVERARCLAAEPPLEPLELERSPLPAAVVPLSTVALASPPTPPPGAGKRRRRRLSFLFAAIAALAMLVASAAFLVLPTSATPRAAGTLVEQPATSSFSTPVFATPAIAATAATREQPLPVGGESPAADSSKASRAMASPRANATSKGLCNPPYTIDAQGRKKFRHECFTERSPR